GSCECPGWCFSRFTSSPGWPFSSVLFLAKSFFHRLRKHNLLQFVHALSNRRRILGRPGRRPVSRHHVVVFAAEHQHPSPLAFSLTNEFRSPARELGFALDRMVLPVCPAHVARAVGDETVERHRIGYRQSAHGSHPLSSGSLEWFPACPRQHLGVGACSCYSRLR